MFSSLFWFVVGASALAVAQTTLVFPGALPDPTLGFARMSGVASVALQYGWLFLTGLAAVFFVVPRVTGVRIRSEVGGQVAGLLINLVVLVAVTITVFGGIQDNPFSEVPPYLDLVLVVAFAICAAVVLRTVAKRAEDRLFVSVYFFLGALLWTPLALAVGNLQGYPGVADTIASRFGIGSILGLWTASVGIGAVFYVVPRATGAPLHSHRLGVASFWALALLAPLTSASWGVFGPYPDWLETIAIAASVGMITVALMVLVNLFGTLRGVWERIPSHPSVKFLVAGTVFWSGSVLWGAVASLRAVARAVGLTEWVTGQIWLTILGASLWGAGIIAYMLPKLVGRRWLMGASLTSSFWLAVGGVVVIAGAAVASGLGTAAVWNAGVSAQQPLSSGGAWSVVLDTVDQARWLALVGALGFAVAAWLYVVNFIRSSVQGDPYPIEVVSPVVAMPSAQEQG